MPFLDIFIPVKKVNYQTTLSPQKVAQRLASKISPEPIKKSIFDRLPLSYHGKISETTFEFGRRSRGNKDHPPTAHGIILENQNNPSESRVEVIITPNYSFKTGVVLVLLLILFACLPAIISVISGYYESIGFFLFLPVFFSLAGVVNYIIFVNYNHKLAKDIERFIKGKIIK